MKMALLLMMTGIEALEPAGVLAAELVSLSPGTTEIR